MNWKKFLLIAAVAGAFTFAGASKSEAGVRVGIGIGFPIGYYGYPYPAYYPYGYPYYPYYGPVYGGVVVRGGPWVGFRHGRRVVFRGR